MNTPIHTPGDALATLQSCNGYYECPKGPDGERRGPLVGYAGTYAPDKHFVGDIYMNVAAIETYPRILRAMATELVPHLEECDWIMGAPEGGKALAAFLAELMGTRYIFPEKKILRLGTDGQREKSEFVMNRHEIPRNSRGILVEDVTNNFSSTAQIVDLVEEQLSEISVIVCLFNRSSQDFYEHGRMHPVVSLAQVPTAQYRQDEDAVRADIEAGNVVWKPKADWPRLMTIMDNERDRAHAVESGA